LTLLPVEGARCWGKVYRVDPSREAETMAMLNHREKAGYALHTVAVNTEGGVLQAHVYVGGPQNPHFLGPAPFQQMLAQIRESEGPSGSNRDYVLQLAEALRGRAKPQDEADLFGLAEGLLNDKIS
jgi:cation transport regulator ChaC